MVVTVVASVVTVRAVEVAAVGVTLSSVQSTGHMARQIWN